MASSRPPPRWRCSAAPPSFLKSGATRNRCCRSNYPPAALWLSAVVGLWVNIAFYGLIFVLSLFFQKQNGLSPLQTGLAFVPMMAVVLPFNILGPRLSERFGPPAVIALGSAIAAAGAGPFHHW